jgi:serine protease AprX
MLRTSEGHRRSAVLSGLALLLGGAVVAPAAGGLTRPQPPAPEARVSEVQVVVRGEAGRGSDVVAAVRGVGGVVERRLAVIDGVVADVPGDSLAALRGSAGVAEVTVDTELRMSAPTPLLSDGWQDEGDAPYDGDKDLGSLYHVTKAVGAHDAWSQHVTGKGVGVALIDSGIAPVAGMHGQVVNGPDLSFESQDDELRHLDSYGHGTHMAAIIAGRDSDVREGNEHDARTFVGVAPGAHVVNVKVATASGAVDVSQILAAIDWVVQHRADPELNIRVLNLSFGTDSTQSHLLDPISYAAQVAWKSGIVVVASAGNDGGSAALRLPARNPYVIAVGAADNNSTNSLDDDLVAGFSNRGDSTRRVDLVAPGKSLASLRAPGSASDIDYPGARVGGRFFRGSGTSQSAAVVSGAAALLLEDRPHLTPDQVKDLLLRTAAPMPQADLEGRGAGQLDVKRAKETPEDVEAQQSWTASTGTGSLERARGTAHVVNEHGEELTGEQDIFGRPWDGASWAEAALSGRSWNGGAWMGVDWTGDCLCSDTWAGRSWNGRSWNGRSWNGRSWNGRSWNGRSWNAGSWS